MPKNLLTQCTNVPPAGTALASLSCSAPSNSAITYDVSMYPDTAAVQAVFKTLLASQGIKTNTNGCTKRNWNGERAWTPPDRVAGRPRRVLPRRERRLGHHVDAHEPRTTRTRRRSPTIATSSASRASTRSFPGELLTFWKFWSGASGTDSIIGKFAS